MKEVPQSRDFEAQNSEMNIEDEGKTLSKVRPSPGFASLDLEDKAKNSLDTSGTSDALP